MADVEGVVAPGFETVRTTFEANVADVGLGGASFCVYVHGRPVVDLWSGAARADTAWSEFTTSILMSATKGLSALCMQVLATRGALDVSAPVADVWPEFAASGKAAITIADVLSHRAGCISVPAHEDLLSWDGSGWDETDELTARLAAAPPAWPPGSTFGYHAITFGWLVGEIVRRIDGRSLGRFFAEEIAGPLDADITIGTPPSTHRRMATIHMMARLGTPEYDRMVDAAADPHTLLGRAFLGGGGVSFLTEMARLANSPRFLEAEQPALNGVGTARGLARVYACLASGGTLDGAQLVSPESIDAFRAIRSSGIDAVMGVPGARGLGYCGNVPLGLTEPPFGPAPHAFGHGGAGTQLGFADVERGVAVGFLRSHLSNTPGLAGRLTRAVYDAICAHEPATR